MRGQVNCRFQGAPDGDFERTLAAFACTEQVALRLDVWFKQGKEGQVQMMEGAMPLNAPWITYVVAEYAKTPTDGPGCLYQFVRTKAIHRCAKELAGKGRRCQNESLDDSEFCKVHNR